MTLIYNLILNYFGVSPEELEPVRERNLPSTPREFLNTDLEVTDRALLGPRRYYEQVTKPFKEEFRKFRFPYGE